MRLPSQTWPNYLQTSCMRTATQLRIRPHQSSYTVLPATLYPLSLICSYELDSKYTCALGIYPYSPTYNSSNPSSKLQNNPLHGHCTGRSDTVWLFFLPTHNCTWWAQLLMNPGYHSNAPELRHMPWSSTHNPVTPWLTSAFTPMLYILELQNMFLM